MPPPRPFALAALVALTLSRAARADEPPPAPEAPAPIVAPPSGPLEVAEPPPSPKPLRVATSPTAPRRDPPEPKRSMVNIARLDVGAMYFRGNKMLGNGTLARYQGGGADARLQGSFFFKKWLGFEVEMHGALSYPRGTAPLLGIDGALDFALQFTEHGAKEPWGALVFGLGGGVENNKKMSWLPDDVRGYPLVHTRFRFSFKADRFTQLELQVIPTSTGVLRSADERIELAQAIGWAIFGVRGVITSATGGVPKDTYSGFSVGAFFGAALW